MSFQYQRDSDLEKSRTNKATNLERKASEARSTSDPQRDARVADSALQGGAGKLPDLGRLEQLFSRDLSSIPVHQGPAAEQACEQLGAEAFAYRGSVVLGNGADFRTTAEETAHVLQQAYSGGGHSRASLEAPTGASGAAYLTDPRGAAESEVASIAGIVAGGGQAPEVQSSLGAENIARTSRRRKAENPEHYQESSHRRAEQTAAGADKALEPVHAGAAQHGHGHADHGHQTTSDEQGERIRTGVTPSGRQGKPVSNVGRFGSPEAEAEALGRARREIEALAASGGVPKVAGTRKEITVTTNRKEGFGVQTSKVKDPADPRGERNLRDAQGDLVTADKPNVMMKALVVFEYVPSTGNFEPVTYYPVA